MILNQTITEFLSILTTDVDQIDSFLSINQQQATLQNDNHPLVEINKESILLLGKYDISKKILTTQKEELATRINIEQFKKFSSNIDIVRLNHLGISYSCPNIEKEVDCLRKITSLSDLRLLEEESTVKNQRWFFIGNLNRWENPLFEIVLTESKEALTNDWIPHFQIDIDTNHSFDELSSLTTKYLSTDFISWKLDIPNYGVVLAMGSLGSINGTKIYLGLGTNLRDTKMHRHEILREI